MSAAQTHIKRFNTHLFGPFNPPQIVRICRGIYDRTPQIPRFQCCSSCLLSSRCRTTNCAARRAAYRAVRQPSASGVYMRGSNFCMRDNRSSPLSAGNQVCIFSASSRILPLQVKTFPCCALRSGSTQSKKIHPAINSLKDVQRRADAH